MTTTTPQRQPDPAAPRRPDLRPQFFLDIPQSELVATDTLLQIKDTVVDTVESRAMSVIYGDAGLGKSFSTRATIQEMNPDLILPLVGGTGLCRHDDRLLHLPAGTGVEPFRTAGLAD